jgi:hypothetical protein
VSSAEVLAKLVPDASTMSRPVAELPRMAAE